MTSGPNRRPVRLSAEDPTPVDDGRLVVAVTPPEAPTGDVTANDAETVRATPAGSVPTTSSVCAPVGAVAGIKTDVWIAPEVSA